MKAWVIIHCELWVKEPNVFIDEMVFHVASSLEKAEKYLKDIFIENTSWWKVIEMEVDRDESFSEDGLFYFYGNRGKKLKKMPYKRALKNFIPKA